MKDCRKKRTKEHNARGVVPNSNDVWALWPVAQVPESRVGSRRQVNSFAIPLNRSLARHLTLRMVVEVSQEDNRSCGAYVFVMKESRDTRAPPESLTSDGSRVEPMIAYCRLRDALTSEIYL